MAIPAFRHAATAVIAHLRGTGPAPNRLAREEDLTRPEVDDALGGRYAIGRQLHGWSHEEAVAEVQQVCTHLFCAVNHELGGKKTFWVSAELAEALQHTSLDISGEVLRTPFPCCAFVFNDAPTLRLVQSLVEKHTTAGREPFRTLTICVYASGQAAEEGYDFVFLADGYDGEWPYLISRSVPTDGKRNLDEILASHPEESTDAFFRTDEMQTLLHLAINAVLYTTCQGYRCEVRSPAPPALQRPGPTKRLCLSSDEAFFLPGRIVVGERAGEARARGKPHSYVIQKRFWVRGHWRRPNPNACLLRRRHARRRTGRSVDQWRWPDASTRGAGGRVGARGCLGLTPGSPRSRGPGWRLTSPTPLKASVRHRFRSLPAKV